MTEILKIFLKKFLEFRVQSLDKERACGAGFEKMEDIPCSFQNRAAGAEELRSYINNRE